MKVALGKEKVSGQAQQGYGYADWKQIRVGVYVDGHERPDVLIERTFWIC